MAAGRQLQTGKKCFRFKASFSPCLILEIINNNPQAMAAELAVMTLNTPRFFMGSSVVIDLEKIHDWKSIDFSALKQLLLSHGLIPVGLKGGDKDQQEASGLPVLQLSAKSSPLEIVKNEAPKTQEPTKVISTPIRSGMQYHAKEGDLIVTAQVSHGAELVAAGHIHVYGTLRGRALAGACGDTSARIFCRTLEAELVSIAGYYLTKEEMPPVDSSGMIQIYLENETLQIRAL